MTLDEIRESIVEMSSNVEFAKEVDKIVRDNHDNSWKEALESLTLIIAKDDEYISIYIASAYKLYYFLYSLENQSEIKNTRVNIYSNTLKTMMKVKNYHDIKHKKLH